ncbi:hypothetical protein ANO11243_086060 [Dothideomycetidae sp. 11243]|nr:hypothetical protein ANO11243_086060 [fungal sp. No.11243]
MNSEGRSSWRKPGPKGNEGRDAASGPNALAVGEPLSNGDLAGGDLECLKALRPPVSRLRERYQDRSVYRLGRASREDCSHVLPLAHPFWNSRTSAMGCEIHRCGASGLEKVQCKSWTTYDPRSWVLYYELVVSRGRRECERHKGTGLVVGRGFGVPRPCSPEAAAPPRLGTLHPERVNERLGERNAGAVGMTDS